MAGFRSLRHAIILFAAVLAGCANLQPAPLENGVLQENIRTGTAVQEGDTVRIVTRDGVSHSLVVTAVQENVLLGHVQGARTDSIVIKVPLNDILTLEVEKNDVQGDAAHLFGGIELAAIFVFILGALFGLG